MEGRKNSMNESLLQQLFDGELDPSKSISKDNQELKQVLREIIEAEKRFLERLSESDTDIYEELKAIQNKYDRLYIYETFAYGFRLGASLFFEALNNKENLARSNSE
jgi:hypothetical protein